MAEVLDDYAELMETFPPEKVEEEEVVTQRPTRARKGILIMVGSN